jgi:hypothetical protein
LENFLYIVKKSTAILLQYGTQYLKWLAVLGKFLSLFNVALPIQDPGGPQKTPERKKREEMYYRYCFEVIDFLAGSFLQIPGSGLALT